MYVAGDVIHCLVKDLGRQILGVVVVASSVIDIVVDFVNVPFIEKTEGFWVLFSLFDQGWLVYCIIHQDDLTSACRSRTIEHRRAQMVAH